MGANVIKIYVFFFLGLCAWLSSGKAYGAMKNTPAVFIQTLNHMKQLSQQDWDQEFQSMLELNIKEVVIQWAEYDASKLWGKSGELDDVVGKIFHAAQRHQVSVYLGIGFHSDWFNKEKWFDLSFLNTQLTYLRSIIPRLHERYKSYSVFKGWYIPHEVGEWDFGDLNLLTPRTYQLKYFFKDIVAELRKLDDKKLIAASLFFTGEKSPIYLSKAVELIFSEVKLDILMVQTGYGVRHWDSFDKQVKPYLVALKATADKYHIKFWAIEEAFVQNNQSSSAQFITENAVVLIKRKSKLTGIADKIVYFEFFHYMSPHRGEQQKRFFETFKYEEVLVLPESKGKSKSKSDKL